MENLKEQILALLGKDDYKPMNLEELKKYFNQDGNVDFLKAIVSLEEEMKIIRSSTNKYHLPSQLSIFSGVVSMHKKGYAFVRLDGDDEEVYISKTKIKDAYHEDKVLIRILNEGFGNNPEGEVIKILERGLKKVVGLFCKQGQKCYVNCDDAKYPDHVIINPNQTLGAVPGHKVVVEISDYAPILKGNVTKIIGHKNDPGVDILSTIERYDVDVEFSQEIYQELESIPDIVLEEELVGRKDLREMQIVTIDGDDAKDLDDAISISKDSKGNYHLGVHIADVSHYVKEGSALDLSAINRGTSIYLVDRVIPMLPHKLSNGICSLNPDVDRLTISCLMEINPQGEVINHEIVPSVIHSKLRMTYSNANKVINGEPFPKEYGNFVKFLDTANQLRAILRHKRDQKGAIDFETKEAKVILNEKGKVEDIVLRERADAEKLIEEFMLIANETVASHMCWLDLPYIYRVHEKPMLKKLQKLMTTLGPLGYHLHGSLSDIHPKALQELIEQSKGSPEQSLVSTMALRCMQKAIYSEQCLGHFGLADDYYTHFTSPIRRYPDLLGHRLLHTFLFDSQQDLDTIKKYEDKVPYLAGQSSDCERKAIDLERDVEEMKKAEYMSNHIGEQFDGIISSVTRFGFFVELENTVEGLVHISELKGDYYEFDDFKNRLVGQKTRKSYGLLDQVKVEVLRVNKIEGTIDFVVVESKKTQRKQKETKHYSSYKQKNDKPFSKYYNKGRKRGGRK